MKRPHLAHAFSMLAAIGFWATDVNQPSAAEATAPTITITSLLHEMVDRDALARFPQPPYICRQASSYNRRSVARDKPGWFADSDGTGFIRKEENEGHTEWVVMEDKGPGCIVKMWTPYFYYGFGDKVGPKIKVYLDGSKTPAIDAHFIELLTNNQWPDSYGPRPPRQNRLRVPYPLAAFTARAGDLYLPIPYARSCKITLDKRPFYFIINYRSYPPGTKVETFSMDRYDAAHGVLAEVAKKLISATTSSSGEVRRVAAHLAPGQTAGVDLPEGSEAIRSLEIQVDPKAVRSDPACLRSVVLTIVCDGEQTVWCPLGDFFCSANALHRLNTWTRTVTPDGRMICRWVMPYRKTGRISLVNLGKQAANATLAVRVGPWKWDDRSMHFHANWRSDDVLPGTPFRDWNFIDIHGKGVFAGDAFTVLSPGRGWWGEGDEKIYVDDEYDVKKFPSHFGTGTEDYYGWAGGRNPTRANVFSRPFLANVSVGSTEEDNPRGFNICTRLRGLDAIPFHNRLVFDMEASPGVGIRKPWNLLDYSAVTFWYALPGATANRPPLPGKAAQPIMALPDLERRQEAIRQVQTKTGR